MYLLIYALAATPVSQTWDVGEKLDRLMDVFVRLVDDSLHLFRVDTADWVIEPALLPAQPVRRCDPKVAVGLELLHQLYNLFILQQQRCYNYHHNETENGRDVKRTLGVRVITSTLPAKRLLTMPEYKLSFAWGFSF